MNIAPDYATFQIMRFNIMIRSLLNPNVALFQLCSEERDNHPIFSAAASFLM